MLKVVKKREGCRYHTTPFKNTTFELLLLSFKLRSRRAYTFTTVQIYEKENAPQILRGKILINPKD